MTRHTPAPTALHTRPPTRLSICSLSICDNDFLDLLPFAVTSATQLRALATSCIHGSGVGCAFELQDWQDVEVGGGGVLGCCCLQGGPLC